ncbi:hypothetical protein PROVRETT_06023 [Providencia rettgeri DSM 1131]|uniref:hypothetical protein n=1 Tax=Providencia rettgeri TaxID=587 RepID=UPI000197CA19|nr:hypothetical protein [Providencia rettgeri]EFE55314.1 hypothetical protein PROVRETT_06023 [Providencia rettgeri DSM 1131]QXA59645.1 hypothetical protein I6L79_09145 [Providencia rettgeri]
MKKYQQYNEDIFSQISALEWVKDLEEGYRGVCPFNEDSITIEHYDEFGQCTVHLGFDDQFAMRDAFGKWRRASAEECIELIKGRMQGSMKLM